MKAQELRIGNFIENTDSQMASYMVVNADVIKQNEHTMYASLEPIPLTEEWLFKFGFWREVKVGSEMGTDGIEFRVYHFDVLTFNTNHGWWYKVQRINETPLEYVHQLQNFYFALTGKELTLKP
jgi:hypothetical protein